MSLFHTVLCSLFFFNDTATTEIYTLSLHDALPIFGPTRLLDGHVHDRAVLDVDAGAEDRKSTRLNSSHITISYAVFYLKKKKNQLTLVTVGRKVVQNKTKTIPFKLS